MDTKEYNQDELEAPQWLNEEFFENIIKKSDQNDKIKVKNFYIFLSNFQKFAFFR